MPAGDVLLGGFALIALVLAAIGSYGVISLGVRSTVALMLSAVDVLASYVPARRATR